MLRLRKQSVWLALLCLAFALWGVMSLRNSRASSDQIISLQASAGTTANAQLCSEDEAVRSFMRLNGPCEASDNSKLYGNPWYAYSLNNFIVGLNDSRVSYRFKAQQSGALSSLQYYVIFTTARSGYSSGNCGDLHISMQTDSGPPNYFPTGEELGSYVINEPCGPNEFGAKPTFPRHNLTPQVQLIQNQYYHVVFKNIDPAMDVNWVSVNGMYDYSGRTPRQLGAPDQELAVLSGTSGNNWKEHTKDAPILEIMFSNGFAQGQTYMEFDYESNENTDIGPGQAVRQIITPSNRDIVATAIRIRAGQSDWSNQEYPNSRGVVSLKSNSGEILASGEFIPYQFADGWSTLPLESPITLKKDTTYYLEIAAVNGMLMFIPLQQGSGYGFSESLEFVDGYVEINKNGSWEAFLDDGKSVSCKCHDISFYIEQ